MTPLDNRGLRGSKHRQYDDGMNTLLICVMMCRVICACSGDLVEMYPNKFLQFDDHRIYIMNTLFDLPRESIYTSHLHYTT